MQDDRAERLITHYVGGSWRVPFGTRQVPALTADGQRAGTLVLAEVTDIARAVAAAQAALPGWARADRAAARAALLAEIAAHLPDQLPPALARRLARPLAVTGPGAQVTALLLQSPAPPAVALRAALRALSGGATLVAMPVGPGGTAAHELAQAAHLAGVPGGVVNLLPGDAAGAAALASHPGVTRVLRFAARGA